ncbi:superoxide dismutase family protein [Edaphobacillus lindanitolerans]|uniref:Superoxide dismutase [Cu-Zn] n=1 Tax=Edaphobacillus lindanitolerans TaxID=550447 RepID=A0A1U7PT95_9BACI|nr:superoxide dismutase family protein [Edaphobacillus lindanitolerans]SIT92936.1 superoxide dismutase, Cu-Zn family [Edaphobacillus lindanitolerans]
MNKWRLLMAGGLLAALLAGCGDKEAEPSDDTGNNGTDTSEDQATDEGTGGTGTAEEGTDTDDAVEGAQEVNVPLKDADGAEVANAVLSEGEDGMVHVDLTVKNLPPGKHAFHIHETGMCEAPDFESAGGHYNPEDKEHGKDSTDGKHAGDFDNIEVNEDGKAEVQFDTDQVTLKEGEDNTVFTEDGTALVIHSGEDDYTSQPAGDAGDRIACGVIEK